LPCVSGFPASQGLFSFLNTFIAFIQISASLICLILEVSWVILLDMIHQKGKMAGEKVLPGVPPGRKIKMADFFNEVGHLCCMGLKFSLMLL